ncbi:hypothetical protein Neosp_009439 [[Neocosmospora] mangrovei]
MRSTVILSLAVCLLGVDSGAASVCRPLNSEPVSASMSTTSSTESIASSATTSSTDGLTTSTTSASVATSAASTEATTSSSSTDASSASTETDSALSTTSATADASTAVSISTTSGISSTTISVSSTTSAPTSSTSAAPAPIATFNIVASGADLDGELLSAFRETSGYAIFKPNPQLSYHRTVQFSVEPDTGYLRTDNGQYVCIEYYSDNSPGPIAYCDAQGGTLAYLECEKPVQGHFVCSVPAPACVLEYDGQDPVAVCTRGTSGERWNRFYTTIGGPGYYVYIGVGDGNGYTPMEWNVEEV